MENQHNSLYSLTGIRFNKAPEHIRATTAACNWGNHGTSERATSIRFTYGETCPGIAAFVSTAEWAHCSCECHNAPEVN